MKYLLAIIMTVSFSFAQSANGRSSGLVMNVSIDNTAVALNYLKVDLDADGTAEVLQGERIVRLNTDEVWVKNTELITAGGDKYYFGNKLKQNDVNLMSQVTSEYGYILVYEENEVIAYIAGKNGNKDSDPMSIIIR